MDDFFKHPPSTIALVRKRADLYPEIGSLFRGLREVEGWGLRQAARIAAGRGLSLLTMNALGFLERGATKNPGPDLLREIATLYGVPYAELVGRFLTARYKIAITASDLPDHATGVQRVLSRPPATASQGKAPHDVASARALKDIAVAYQTFLRAVSDVSDQLARVVSDASSSNQISTTDGGTPRRRRRR